MCLTLIASIVKLDILTAFKTYLHDIELHRFGIPCCQRQIRPQKLLAAGHRVHPWCVISFNMVQYFCLESIFYSIQVCLVGSPHHMWKNKSNTYLEAAPGNQKGMVFACSNMTESSSCIKMLNLQTKWSWFYHGYPWIIWLMGYRYIQKSDRPEIVVSPIGVPQSHRCSFYIAYL